MIAFAAALGALVALALTLVRLFAGPTLYDRALVVNSVIMKAALICAALSVALRRSEGIDAALILILGSFVFNTAVLKFFRAQTFQAPMAHAEERS